jgi:hypothetical protein
MGVIYSLADRLGRCPDPTFLIVRLNAANGKSARPSRSKA